MQNNEHADQTRTPRYDTANIDYWSKHGLSNVNPDPWSRKRHQSGNMLQSGNGNTHRNFELLLSDPRTASLAHVSRDGHTLEWSMVSSLPVTTGSIVGQPSIIGTSFNRDFHAAWVDSTNHTLQHWVYSQSTASWSHRSTISSHNITGIPGLVQADDSSLVVVVKHADGSLNEWRKLPNTSTWTLTSPPLAASDSIIAQSGPSLVQSNVGLDVYSAHGNSSGTLYAVAVRTDGTMQLFSKEGRTGTWKSEEVFGSNVPGDASPVMIQDFYATENELSQGKLRLVVAVGGEVQHWVRQGEGKWEMLDSSAGEEGVRNVWSLVQGSFGGKMQMLTEGGADGGYDYWEWDGKWHVVERLKAVGEEGWKKGIPVSGG